MSIIDSDLIFHIKQGNTRPALRRQLLDNDGLPIDLSGATVRIKLVTKNGTVLVNDALCTTEADGWIEYEWQVGDTDVAGWHKAEIKVEYSPGQTETFPNHEYLQIHIDGAL